MSSQVALAGRPARKYACCELGGDDSLTGTLFFWQHERGPMHVKGHLLMDAADVVVEEGTETEARYMGISANASDGTCLDLGALWPFEGEAVDTLQPALFDVEGYAEYSSNSRLASLFGDDAVFGRSVSLFADETNTGAVDACCTITEMDEDAW